MALGIAELTDSKHVLTLAARVKSSVMNQKLMRVVYTSPQARAFMKNAEGRPLQVMSASFYKPNWHENRTIFEPIQQMWVRWRFSKLH